MKLKLKILYAFFILLTILSLHSSAQKTFTINKRTTDSISLKKYRIYVVSANEEINFISREILSSKRISLTKDQALYVDNEFHAQFVNASLQQYSKQHKQSAKHLDSLEWKNQEVRYQKTIKNFERNLIKDQRMKIQTYDRYFFGYLNEVGERLVLMRFDPHKLKYYSIPGSGESHVDVLTIFVYNLDKKILSLSGWADFNEN